MNSLRNRSPASCRKTADTPHGTRRLLRLVPLLLVLLAAATPARSAPPEPHFDASQHQVQYHGPGRQLPAPEKVDEILIGYFGPTDPHDPLGPMWQAAQAAVAEANREGGYQGKPFRLLPAWARDPWGGGVKQLAQMVYDQHVWAIISGVDGATAHLAEQVAAKARLPVINAASTDKTVNLANVPWVFSLAPGDHLLCPPLADEIVRQTGQGHFALVSANDHDSRELVRQLNKDLLPLRAAASRQFQFEHGSQDLRRLVQEVLHAQPRVVVVFANADASAAVVAELRQQGFTGSIVGGPAAGSRRFLQKAGKAALGVIFPRLTDTSVEASGDLPSLVSAQHVDLSVSVDTEPILAHDYTTFLVGDAVRLLVEAIRRGGLNRARIRDALADVSPWQGRAGTVRWDKLGRNTREIQLDRIAP